MPVAPSFSTRKRPGHRHRHQGLAEGDAGGCQLGFAAADAGHLGVRVDDGGHGVVAHAVGSAEHVADRDQALARGRVGEQAATGDVAAGPDAGHGSPSLLRGADAFAREIDAGRFEAEVFDDGHAAGGVQDAVGLDHATFVAHAAGLDLEHLAASEERHASLLHGLLEAVGNVAIAAGGNLRQHLEHRHGGTGSGEETGEFKADVASADHGHAGRAVRRG